MLKRSPLPPRKKYLGHSKKRIPRVNAKRQAKKLKRYKAALSNPHAKAQKKRIAIRSQGICECGCGIPFTTDDPMQRGHLTYTRLGNELDSDVIAIRRSCNLAERLLRKPYQRIR